MAGSDGIRNSDPNPSTVSRTSAQVSRGSSSTDDSATCTRKNTVNGLAGPPEYARKAVSTSTSANSTAGSQKPRSARRGTNDSATLPSAVNATKPRSSAYGSSSSKPAQATPTASAWPNTAPHRSLRSQVMP